MRQFLRNTAIKALEADGWKVERIARSGKSSVRRITKGNVSTVVTIRTTQDTWIAFPRNKDGSWRTLDDADDVVAVSVDDRENPRFANIHLMDGDNIRDRFNRAYKARKDAGHSIPDGRGIWVSLYEKEQKHPATLVGAGAGLEFKPIATVPIDMAAVMSGREADNEDEASSEKAEPSVEREAAGLASVEEPPRPSQKPSAALPRLLASISRPSRLRLKGNEGGETPPSVIIRVSRGALAQTRIMTHASTCPLPISSKLMLNSSPPQTGQGPGSAMSVPPFLERARA